MAWAPAGASEARGGQEAARRKARRVPMTQTVQRLLLWVGIPLLVVAGIVVWRVAQPGQQSALPPTPTPPAIGATTSPPGGQAAQATQTAQAARATQTAAAAPPTTAPAAPVVPGMPVVPAVPLPAITLDLRTPVGATRGVFELTWDAPGAERVRISEVRGGERAPMGPDDLPSAGSLPVRVVDRSEFLVEASNAAGTASESVGVVILAPPEISEFRADPTSVARGGEVTLGWTALRAGRAGIPGVRDSLESPAGGSLTVRPDATTIYTLIAENESGRVERSVTVQVVEQ
jgi:hypothetical protein